MGLLVTSAVFLIDSKINAESLSQHDEKHVVPTPLSGIRVGGRRNMYWWCLTVLYSLTCCWLYLLTKCSCYYVRSRVRDVASPKADNQPQKSHKEIATIISGAEIFVPTGSTLVIDCILTDQGSLVGILLNGNDLTTPDRYILLRLVCKFVLLH
jgi:hypothetical protein